MTSTHLLVADVLSQVLDIDEPDLSPRVELQALPGWDSVNALRVLLVLEREIGATVDFERFVAATTVGALDELVASTTRAAEGRA